MIIRNSDESCGLKSGVQDEVKMELKKEKKRQMKRDRDRLSLASEQELLQVADDQKIPKKNMNKDSPWNFEVEYNDHFETPKIAYTDLLPVLQQAARDSKKSLSEVGVVVSQLMWLMLLNPLLCF